MHPFLIHLRRGVMRGLRGYVWLLKILVPVSFLTLVLQASGLLGRLDVVLAPLMGVLHLPAVAALPLIIGMLTGIYGAIAAMAVLPLSMPHMILIAVFLLISHALVQEGIIQGRSGMPAVTATVVRLAASVVTVWLVAPFLDLDEAQGISASAPVAGPSVPFTDAFGAWVWDMVGLGGKILVIIVALLTLLELMRAYRVTDHAVRVIRPVLRIMGLSDAVGMIWLTAAVFGISYGGAVIVEETRTGRLKPEALRRLHLSIGINHAMVEDPALFLSLGLPAFWLWVPRLLAAVAAVYLAAALAWVRRRKAVAAHQSQI